MASTTSTVKPCATWPWSAIGAADLPSGCCSGGTGGPAAGTGAPHTPSVRMPARNDRRNLFAHHLDNVVDLKPFRRHQHILSTPDRVDHAAPASGLQRFAQP